mmetsp:Transcript_14567/g.29729  ORF Transcript_14567/g.29729 Transcript_14567/m.29729 type:complete len:353 (-) Transcript_14567:1255-2313(-)
MGSRVGMLWTTVSGISRGKTDTFSRWGVQVGRVLSGSMLKGGSRMMSLSGRSVGSILKGLAASSPLKEAVKFWETGHDRSMAWSFSDLDYQADRLARGLLELGLAKGDQVGVWLPFGAPEMTVTLLAAAKIGVVVVIIDPPPVAENGVADKVNPSPVSVALDEFSIKTLLIWHEFIGNVNQNGSTEVLDQLFHGVAERDGMGLAGMTRLTGKEFYSPRYPNLRHVVHTGTRNVRSTVNFRNLLVGREGMASTPVSDPSVTAENTWTIMATTGARQTHGDAISAGEAVASKLRLSTDPLLKSGKFVLSPSEPPSATIAATVLRRTLLISPCLHPNAQRVSSVAEAEQATIAMS